MGPFRWYCHIGVQPCVHDRPKPGSAHYHDGSADDHDDGCADYRGSNDDNCAGRNNHCSSVDDRADCSSSKHVDRPRYDNYADRAHNGCANDYHDDGSCGGSAGYEPDHCSSNYCGPDHGCTRYDGEATGDNGCAIIIIIDRRSGR